MKILRYVNKYVLEYKISFLKYVILSLLFWLVTISTPYISGRYIDVLVYVKEVKVVYTYTAIILFLNICHIFVSYLKDIGYTKLLNDVSFDLSKHVFEHLKKAPISALQSRDSVYLSKRINDDSNAIADFCISNFVSFFTNIFSLVIAFVILVKIDKLTSLILLLTVPIYLLIYNKFKGKLYQTNYMYKEKVSNYYSCIAEQFKDIDYIKINVLFDETAVKLKNSYNDFKSFLIKFFKFNYFFSNTSLIILKILNVFVICYGGLEVIKGEISIGSFTIISTYFNTIISSINYFITLSSNYQQTMVSYDRMSMLENEPIENIGDKLLSTIKTIDFKDVGFSYSKEKKLISNLTKTLQSGKIYCIKGLNGAGKSTLLKVMIGLYENFEGEIFYDNINLKEINHYHLRRKHIGFVMQDSKLIKGTILENLQYGLENFNEEEAIYWCKKLGIYQMIDNLPKKFNTIISEDANNLSGGEKQKISIARVLVKDASILVFDEPTSALDFKSIDLIKKILKEISSEKIIIVITHDDLVADIADEIINI